MRDDLTIRDQIAENGFATCRNVLSSLETTELLTAVGQSNEHAGLRKRAGVFAVRNLLEECSEIRTLVRSEVIRSLVEPALGRGSLPVRGILFDKVPEANWKVPWHQDVTIAVRNKVEVDGFGPWSVKAEVLHVQPPADILNNMLSVRLHLDPCGEENGALRVLPGTHRLGRIAEDRIAATREDYPEHVCEMGVGDVLLMKPLLLHASSASLAPDHRRVIHIDFASIQLPPEMQWFSEMDLTS
jgi:ectoine hydroxylase-related dioxygenase (phytanoyl-CoA dioxygenase family)